MVRIRITQPLPGSMQGVRLSGLCNGSIYDVSIPVGTYLLARGAAVLVDPTLPSFVQPIPDAYDIAELATHVSRFLM